MIGFLRKIKDTLFSGATPEDRAEAMIRIHFLEYLTFDIEFYGNFYVSSSDILQRYSKLSDDCTGVMSNLEIDKKMKFIEEAFAELIQLEFDSWARMANIGHCDCETYFSFRRWYNFNFIAKGLLEVNSTSAEECRNAGSKYLVVYLMDLIYNGKRDLGI